MPVFSSATQILPGTLLIPSDNKPLLELIIVASSKFGGRSVAMSDLLGSWQALRVMSVARITFSLIITHASLYFMIFTCDGDFLVFSVGVQ